MIKEIVCFGDSNTYGLIPGTKRDRYDRNTRWTGRLEKALAPLGYHLAEEGLCGRTTIFDDPTRIGRNGAAVLPYLLETHHPISHVILMLGTNDCKTQYHASAEQIAEGISLLIEQIRAEDPKIQILLLSPIHLGDGVGEKGYDPEFDAQSVAVSHQLKEAYQRIAKQNHCDFLAASDLASPSPIDREHLTEEGHRRLASAIFERLLHAKFYERQAV